MDGCATEQRSESRERALFYDHDQNNIFQELGNSEKKDNQQLRQNNRKLGHNLRLLSKNNQGFKR
jgi:hypothetical protein